MTDMSNLERAVLATLAASENNSMLSGDVYLANGVFETAKSLGPVVTILRAFARMGIACARGYEFMPHYGITDAGRKLLEEVNGD